MIKKLLFALFVISTMSSCVMVKGYEKVNLNDPEPELKNYIKENRVTYLYDSRDVLWMLG